MRIFLIARLALLILLASSCSGRSSDSDTVTVDTISISGHTVIPDSLLHMPGSIYATDSRIIVVNFPAVDTLVDIYSRDGRHLRSLLTRGNGPDEAANIFSSYINAADNRLMLSIEPNRLHALDLSDGAQKPLLGKAFEYIPDSGDSIALSMECYRLADGTVLAGTPSPEGFFAIFGPDGSFSRFAVDRIPLSDFGEGFPDYMIYNFCRPTGAVSPDGKHFACVFGNAEMLGFASLDGDSVIFKTDYVEPPKGITIKIGDGWTSFEYTDEHKLNYIGRPAVSNSHVYVRYIGMPHREARKMMSEMDEGEIKPQSTIRVFDFNGNLCRVIRLDVNAAIAVSPDNKTLYALTETAADGLSCVAFTLPPFAD